MTDKISAEDFIKAFGGGIKQMENIKPIVIDNEDFGTLAVCSIRYCRGRQTYMPRLVRGIVKAHLSEISDKDLQVLINDCNYTLTCEDNIDPKGWTEWKNTLIAEQNRRKGDTE